MVPNIVPSSISAHMGLTLCHATLFRHRSIAQFALGILLQVRRMNAEAARNFLVGILD